MASGDADVEQQLSLLDDLVDRGSDEDMEMFLKTLPAEIMDKYEVADKVLEAVAKFRRQRKSTSLDKMRNLIAHVYKFDAKEVDKEMKKFLDYKIKNGWEEEKTGKRR